MDDGEHLIQQLQEAARAVFADSPVFLAYAHGGRIDGSPRPDSDSDIGYYLTGFPNAKALPTEQELVLAAQLSCRLGREIKVRDFGRAPLAVRGRMLVRGVRIYCCDELARVDMEVGLLSEYHDWKEVLRKTPELFDQVFAEEHEDATECD